MQTPDQAAQTASPPQNSPTAAAPAVASAVPAPGSPEATAHRHSVVRIVGITLTLVLGAGAAFFVYPWVIYRSTHSITEDAFIEAHIVNIAPQSVSGHLVRYLVEENDRVEQGQVLAEIDPIPYRDQVELARSKVETAEAELRRQEAALDRLRLEVPLQVEIAKRTLAASLTEHAKAEKSLELTRDDVEKGIDEAQAGLEASKADLVLADQEFSRFTTLFKEDAVALRRSQEVTRSRDTAVLAHRRGGRSQARQGGIGQVEDRRVDARRRSFRDGQSESQDVRRSGRDGLCADP